MSDPMPYACYVFANWGRWVVFCSSPHCDSAMQVYPGQEWVVCGEPGCWTTIGPLVWPPDPEAVEAILALRPNPKTRNWYPTETLHDLIAENVAHGVPLPVEDPARKQVLARTADGILVGGTISRILPSDIRRHQLEGRQ